MVPTSGETGKNNVCEAVLFDARKECDEGPNVRGVFVRCRNSIPFRKGCVASGRITKASDECEPTSSPPHGSPYTVR